MATKHFKNSEICVRGKNELSSGKPEATSLAIPLFK